jgi:hypothetical protein
MKFLANFFSYIIHPLLIPTFGFMTLLACCPEAFHHYPIKTIKLSLMITFAMTCLFPSIIYLMMKGLNIISDLDVRDKRQRIIPYLVALFFYLSTFLIFKHNDKAIYTDSILVSGMMLGATLSLGISFFVNNFLKISLHANGVGGYFGICMMMTIFATNSTMPFILLSILMMGVIGASRILLDAHTTREVALGLLSGIAGQVLSYWFYIK